MTTTTLPIDALAVDVELKLNGLQDRVYAFLRQLGDTRRCVAEMTLTADLDLACSTLADVCQTLGGLLAHTDAIDRALVRVEDECLNLI